MEDLGGRFVRDVVMKGTNANIMNAMERCVLALYTYDDNPEDISVENVLRQSLELIAKLPEIAVYSYHAYRHFRKDETLFIRNPQETVTAPNPHKTPEEMTVGELQAAILAKMAGNGPVDDQMKKTVYDNIWHDSLVNWLKSFR